MAVSFRNIRTSMRKWGEFQASKHTENIHMRRQFPLSLLALVITIIAIHLVSCTKSLDDPGNSYLEWQKMSEGDYGIYVEAVQAFLEDDTNLDSPYYSAITDMESFRPTGIRVQTGEAPAYGEVKAYLFNCGSWLVEVLKKSDDETSTVTACFNASVIDENAILSAAGKRWSTLVEDLRNYYSYLPIKANETVFSKMYVDCEDGRRNISYYADVSKDGDYAFWVIPKQPKYEYVNAIIYTLERDYPSCFWTIIEPTDPENLQDYNIHCKMPAMDQRWCKILCGLENPRDWHTDVNGGLIQKEYKSKSSNLQLDYVSTRVMLMNKKGEEADAIFGKSLEDMTKAQNDVIGDLIAANDNFQKIVIF